MKSRTTGAFHDAFWVAAAESLAVPTGLVTAAFLTRRLGPADYAQLVLAASVVTWLQWTIASVWARSAVKGVAASTTPSVTAGDFLRVYAWSGFGAALALAALSGPIASLLSSPAVSSLLRWYALDIAIFALTHGYRSVHAGLGLFRGRALGAAARWISRMVLTIAAVSSGWGVEGAVAANIGASLVDLLINRGSSPVRWRLFGPLRDGLLRQSSPLVVNGLLLRLFERLDLFLLSALGTGQIAVGAYGAAQNLSIAGSIVTAAASPVLLSSMSHAIRSGATASAAHESFLACRIAVAIFPMAVAASLNARVLARALFGVSFEFVASSMALLILSVPLTILLSFLQCTLIAFDRTRTVAWTTACLLAGAAGLHAIIIPQHQILGASGVTLLSVLSACVVSALAMRPLGVRFPGSTLTRSLLVSLVLVAAARLGSGPSWIQLLGLAAGGLTGQLMLGEVSRDEWRSLVRWSRNRRSR